MQPTVGFIGAGQMSRSIIGGLVQSGYPADALWGSNRTPAKNEALHAEFGIHTTTDNLALVAACDIIVLAVKPNLMPLVCAEITPKLSSKKLVMSIATGIKLNVLARWLETPLAIIRCMPNTPSMVHSGASVLCANALATQDQRDQAESICRAVGIVKWLEDETLMDTVTGLSGSGPAYFYVMMDALAKAAQAQGLDPHMAAELAIQTALGAARMALESNESFEALTAQVTSPGGATFAALDVLQSHQFAHVVGQALCASKNRSAELAAEVSQTKESK